MYDPFNLSAPVELPDKTFIAETMLDTIENMARQGSVVCDYALNILSEQNYRNRSMDELIALPGELLEVICNNPNNVQMEQRINQALSDCAILAAIETVKSDREFVRLAERDDRQIFLMAADIVKGIQATMSQYGASKPEETAMGNYKPNRGRSNTQPTSTRVGRTRPAGEKKEVVRKEYEPREEKKTKPVRPMLRQKDKDMTNRVLAYKDHATFNNLSFRREEEVPTPDFFGYLTDPVDQLNTNYIHSAVGNIVAGGHLHAITEAWCHTLTTESSCNRSNTVLDADYQVAVAIHMFSSPEERTEAVLALGAISDLFATDKITSLEALHGNLTRAKELFEKSPLAVSLFREFNRVATVAVNQMIKYDLALNNLFIDDFHADYKDLVEHLYGLAKQDEVRAELDKWGRIITARVVNIALPDEALGPYRDEVADRTVYLMENHFTSILPVSAGALGIQLDDRTSFVGSHETPREFEYMTAILNRAKSEGSGAIYTSVNLITSDGVRFVIRETDIRHEKSRTTNDKYLAITFTDYQ